MRVNLHDGWSLRAVETDGARSVPATVPGCVHTDLLAAGLIDDPFVDRNESRLSWIGRTDWVYQTRFDPGVSGERVDLVCGGLDTVAAVTLNGAELGRTANMHRSYRFPVQDLLREQGNELTVRFASAQRYAEELRERLGSRPGAYAEPYNFIRKMACNFGWDWGPTVVTAGIWRPIGLHAWSVARLAQVRPLITVDGDTGVVDLFVTLERATDGPLASTAADGPLAATAADGPLALTAAVGQVRARVTVPAGESTAAVRLAVHQPSRWWPRGYGQQPLYALRVELSTQDGEPLDKWERRIGFRTVRLDTAPDEHGTPYTVVVNGREVFVRGVNWIPEDAFVTRLTRDRYAVRLAQACEANVNYVRIWGGGIYESDDFYDVADELGLMVGQDFLFSCAAYPEEEPLRSEIEAEAREQVVRLATHPSLVTWTGNNENIWGYHDWDWRGPLAGRSWGRVYYLDLLPRIVSELDPTRPYWPGSPYSGDEQVPPNDPAHGSMHIWDVWNTEDYVLYRRYRPRFVAEFGYQAPASYATLRRALTDDPLRVDSSGLRQHQKAIDGEAKLRRGLEAHLPPPRDFDDWHYLTQVNQARAVSLGIEHFRSLMPLCQGSVMWQLNDCWPSISWSAVDWDGRRKPLWYAMRRSYADRLLTIQPDPDGLSLVAVNDCDQPWSTAVEVSRLQLDGQARAKSTLAVEVPARSARRLPLARDLSTADDPRAELLLASASERLSAAGVSDAVGTADEGQRAWWFFAEDRDIAYPTPDFDVAVEPVRAGFRVRVTARTLLRDVVLYPDRVDPAASVDEALVTVLPGESVAFTVGTAGGFDPQRLATRPVLRCVNDVSRTDDVGRP